MDGEIPMQTESAAGDAAIDVDGQNFAAEVVEASHGRLVLLDLWAPWCEPCKELTPRLEALAAASGGAVRLARMNIDLHPEVAQQLRVQSIPAVFAFKDGQIVDGFAGALPDSELNAFVAKHIKGGAPEVDLHAAATTALAAEDWAGAAALFAELLARAPDDAAAMAGLAGCYMKMGETEKAAEIVVAAPPDHPAFAGVRAALELAETSTGKDADALAAAVAADPADHQARFDLALAHHAAGRKTEAIDQMLEIVARARDWNDDLARRRLLDFFEAYGATDEATQDGRRKLSSLLFN